MVGLLWEGAMPYADLGRVCEALSRVVRGWGGVGRRRRNEAISRAMVGLTNIISPMLVHNIINIIRYVINGVP